MMDFPRKESIMQKVAMNGTLYQQLMMAQQTMLQLAQIVDQTKGTNMAEQIAQGIMSGGGVAPLAGGQGASNVEQTEALGGSEKEEASNTKKARKRVAESTDPT
jgi:hypothetical protein